MATETETKQLATLRWAATLPCRTCGGKRHDMSNPVNPHQGAEDCWSDFPLCKACQQKDPDTGELDGKPTGRQFPELGRECHHIAINGPVMDSGWIFEDDFWETESDSIDGPSSCNCHGTGILANETAEAYDATAERCGAIEGKWQRLDTGRVGYQYDAAPPGIEGTIELARRAALVAVLEAWAAEQGLEVSNDAE